mgnify:CR=1 FL=1
MKIVQIIALAVLAMIPLSAFSGPLDGAPMNWGEACLAAQEPRAKLVLEHGQNYKLELVPKQEAFATLNEFWKRKGHCFV